MALPIILFFLLIGSGIILFLFGASRESMRAGFAFICLSGVILLVSGLLIWSNGIQLTTVSQFIDSSTGTSVVYETASASAGSALWIISNLLTFGSIGLILLSLTLTVRERRQLRAEEREQIYG